MLTDARRVPRGSTVDADVCVIGAGAAGITLARELARNGVRVLLLESGPFRFDQRTQALYKGKLTGLQLDPLLRAGLDAPRLRFFGGTTNHWSGFCRPFPPLDFEERAWVPRSGWPFDRAALDPYYVRALDVLHLGPYEYSVDYWRGQGLIATPPLDDPDTPHTIVQITESPRLGPVYHDEIVGAAGIHLHIWANVTRLVLDDAGNHVTSVDVATLSGNRYRARAKQFVLATGGLEVPRLLLASNDRRPKGIGNEHDLVGRHFMEHVNIATGLAVLEASAEAMAPYIPSRHEIQVNGATRALSLQALMLVDPGLQRLLGLRSCEVTFEYPFPIGDANIEKLFPGSQPGIDLVRAGGLDPRIGMVVRVLCEQEPNPRSRVTLVRDRDELGMPRIALDWRVTDDDRRSMLRTLRVVGERIGARGRGRLRVDIGGFTDADPRPGAALDWVVNTGSHHMGTARMHVSPGHGVVDPDLRVHSVKNLYIGGSAVFPTSGANPPTMTIVALALRLADHLRGALT